MSSVVIVSRARSGSLSISVTVPSGPSTTWSIAAAIRRRLATVECTRPPRIPWQWCSSDCSARSSAAAARGSLLRDGPGSFATSSDCTTMRVSGSTASTSYSMAATERWANDTTRVERTLISRPVGERQWTSRRSTPSRRSSTRSWCRTSP